MLIRYLSALFLLIITCSCKEPSAEERFDKKRDKVVHHALKNFIKSMNAKGYHAAGVGEGLDHSTEKQNYLGVTFDIEQLPNIEFARKVEIETLQDFLNYINLEEGIQDYVAEYPYPIKFIHVAFINKHPEQGLFSVTNCENELIYRKDDPCKPIGPSTIIHKESYEDAVRILEQQQSHPG
jgi:hypothetical protein